MKRKFIVCISIVFALISAIIFLIVLVISGYFKEYTITPEQLPTAKTNQYYTQIIDIRGGKVVDQHAILNTNIPIDLGLTVEADDPQDYGYNHINIKGTPKHKGVFKIHINVGFYAGGSNTIDKEYTLVIED